MAKTPDDEPLDWTKASKSDDLVLEYVFRVDAVETYRSRYLPMVNQKQTIACGLAEWLALVEVKCDHDADEHDDGSDERLK